VKERKDCLPEAKEPLFSCGGAGYFGDNIRPPIRFLGGVNDLRPGSTVVFIAETSSLARASFDIYRVSILN
jgi:hypothetical protein